MTLEEAKRRRDVFMEQYGDDLVQHMNAVHPFPKTWTVSREVFEAIEAAFQHWPMCAEDGEEYVGHCCFFDPSVPYQHVLFKGIPVTYQADSEVVAGEGR